MSCSPGYPNIESVGNSCSTFSWKSTSTVVCRPSTTSFISPDSAWKASGAPALAELLNILPSALPNTSRSLWVSSSNPRWALITSDRISRFTLLNSSLTLFSGLLGSIA